MTDVNASLVDDIKATRAELLKRGRCTGNLYKRDTGEVCLLGAVGTATVQDFISTVARNEVAALDQLQQCERPSRVVKTLARHLEPVLGEISPDERVWRFNDNRKNSDEDVTDLLDKALADLGGL